MINEQLRVVEFRTQYRVGKDPVDLVCLAPAGAAFEKTRTWHRVKDLMPSESPEDRVKESESYQALMGRWQVIGPAYEAWRAGNEIPEGGTPLSAWAGVTSEQAAFLRKLGVRSVEDVAAMSELAVKELRWPGSSALPALAKEFLAGVDIAEKDAELTEMRERLAATEQMLNDMVGDKPKRGRPARKPAESEAA